MKKRLFALLLAFVTLISLTACGGESSNNVQSPNSGNAPEANNGITAEPAPEPTENPNLIVLDEPLVIIENEFFKLELIRFRTAEEGFHITGPSSWKWSDGTVYFADIQFYNKSEYQYKVGCDIYIGDEGARNNLHIGGGNNEAPSPGKNALMEMGVYRWDGMQELPIELDELYQLNGTLWIFGDEISHTEFNFSVPVTMESGTPLEIAPEVYEPSEAERAQALAELNALLASAGNANTIKLDEPVVLMDNDFCRMELLSFWKTNNGWHPTGTNSWGKGYGHSGTSFGVDIQFYNKSESEYKVITEVYIGDENVCSHREIGDTNWNAPAPGKNALMKLTVARWDGEKEGTISMDELFLLNGSIKLSGDGVTKNKLPFSILDAMVLAGK